jgi:hypothetical protein
MEIQLLIRKIKKQVLVGKNTMIGEFSAIVWKSAVAARSKVVLLLIKLSL